MSLVFYYAPMSTAVVTHCALEELGIPYEKVKMDFQSGSLKKPEFLAINPNGSVPAIVHDGTPIFESAAIVIYLGETFGVEKGLYPAPGPKRAEALKWIVWANATLAATISRKSWASSDRIPAEQRNEAAAAVAVAEGDKHLGVLDAALAGKQWLLGDTFTLVDSHVSGFAGYASMVGFDTKKWTNLTAWLERASNRPANAAARQP